MKRKIVQHGSSSLTVSLPYKWVKQFNLKKGDEIELERYGRNLLIRTEKEEKRKEYVFHIKNKKFFFKRYLINLYKQGYDEIKLVFDCPVPIESVIEKIDEMLGFEIVDQGKNYCVIRNVAKVVEEEFDTMLRRLFLVTLSMAEESLAALKSRDYEKFKEFYNIEKENNKLVNFCQRVLNKKGWDDLDKTMHLFSIIDKLELIGDCYGDLSIFLSKNKIRASPKTLAYYSRVNFYFREIYKLFYSFNEEKIFDLKKMRLGLYDEFLELFNNKSCKELVILHYLKEVLEQLHHIEFSLIKARELRGF